MNKVLCDYCGTVATLVGGIKIYPHRKNLYKKNYWLCETCGAYVGTYWDNSPLGRLANAELRMEKRKAHKIFDPLWQKGKQSRSEAYIWLAKELKIHTDQCHIGMFDIDMCKKVVSVCMTKGAHGTFNVEVPIMTASQIRAKFDRIIREQQTKSSRI